MKIKHNILVVLLTICFCANAQFQILHHFLKTSYNGPYGSLVTDGAFLYGMTAYGGPLDSGSVFKIKSDGTGYTTLLDFNGTNGCVPYLNSLFYDAGFLFGMTDHGGTSLNCYGGCGVLFKMKADGTGYSKLIDFTRSANGGGPSGSVISDGTFLYGVAGAGGALDNGVIFKIKPDGTGYDTLHSFSLSPDGVFPCGTPVFDGTFLYGMTAQGGANGFGTIYKIKPDGTGYTILLNLDGTINGSFPQGSFIFDGTFLYGMTSYGGTSINCNGGCGVLFKIKPDGTGYSKLLDFNGHSNGANPNGDLVSDGTFLYGMTAKGGDYDEGVVFKIKPDGTEYSKMIDFAGVLNGSYPYGSLIYSGTSLYGMTLGGGDNDRGTIFKINLAAPDGIAEYKMNPDVSIFPNPFSTQLTIQTKTDLNGATLILYNALGEMVKEIKNISGNTISLSRANLPAGAYFICISKDGKMIANKKVLIGD